jgi:site-specific DNA-methyltransferase (adenine-specific)
LKIPWKVLQGDCREKLRELPADSVHAIVTDPPYGIGFMGKKWDTFKPERVDEARTTRRRKGTLPGAGVRFPQKYGNAQGGGPPITYDESRAGNVRFQEWCTSWAVECLRVARPGAHLAVCGGPRTYHRVACALEDAGWELRDCLAWLYGSGFPKSKDIGKAIDEAAGAVRDVVGPNRFHGTNGKANSTCYGAASRPPATAPATEQGRTWDGWGTALKPAWEPILLARKPFKGPVHRNVLEHGTGGLNVKGCQLEFAGFLDEATAKKKNAHAEFESGPRQNQIYDKDTRPRDNWNPAGRWPPNVALDEEAAELLDATTETASRGHRPGDSGPSGIFSGAGGGLNGVQRAELEYLDEGGQSRFFYVAKASREEREEGLEGMPRRAHGMSGGASGAAAEGEAYGAAQSIGLNRVSHVRNHHPTVKPLSLMAWICRLLTPPGGTILDPFTGSGSTGAAAVAGGWAFVGVEIEPEYVELARRRIHAAAPLFSVEEK